MTRFHWSLLGLVAMACGGEPPPPAVDVPPPVASAPPVSSAATATVAGRRTPPDTLLRYWPLGPQARLALYADVGGLLRTELGRGIVPGALSLAKGTMTDAQALCIRGATDSVKDLIVGAEDDGVIVLAQFDDTAFDPTPCLQDAGAKPARVEGARQAFDLHGTLLVHETGVLVVGLQRLVKDAMHPRTDLSGFPHLSLGPDEYITCTARFDQDIRGKATVLASSERFRLDVEVDHVPTFIADQVESQLESLRGKPTVPGLDGDAGVLAARLLQSVQVKRTGSHLTGTFDLHEPVLDQGRDLGMVATLGVAGVRKYLVDAKSAEARNSIGQIAKDYQAWWERQDGKGARRKLASFPPVPATVPRGTKYASSPADWQAWAPLRFQLDEPQYYQYEVRVSKDGSGADIIARGNLDGDGKDSEFKLHVTVDRHGTMRVDPSIEERDPED